MTYKTDQSNIKFDYIKAGKTYNDGKLIVSATMLSVKKGYLIDKGSTNCSVQQHNQTMPYLSQPKSICRSCPPGLSMNMYEDNALATKYNENQHMHSLYSDYNSPMQKTPWVPFVDSQTIQSKTDGVKCTCNSISCPSDGSSSISSTIVGVESDSTYDTNWKKSMPNTIALYPYLLSIVEWWTKPNEEW
jgi:hypothetical protein